MATLTRTSLRVIAKLVRLTFARLLTKRARLRPLVRQLGSWLRRNFGNSMPCTVCVSLGVWSTNFLPIVGISLILEIPSSLPITISPFAALAIAALVVDKRAYNRWNRARRAEMGLRMLRAYTDGLLWMRWCVPLPRRKNKPRPKASTP